MGKPSFVIDQVQEKVFLDGEVVGSLDSNNPEYGFSLLFEEVNRLSGVKIIDIINEEISEIKIQFEESFYHECNSIFSYYTDITFWGDEISYINIHLDIDNWDFQFGIHSFFIKLTKSLSNIEFMYINEEQFDDFKDIFRLGLRIYLSKDVWIRDILIVYNEIVELLKVKVENIFLELSQENRSNLSSIFTFPPEIQSSCEQYLIYFATFLKDIGINAETNIESKEQSTLFTVIPENGEEALGKIKEALHVYLSLPESPEFENEVTEFQDIGVQQLASQVYFLKSQLMMANSAIQLKDATIKSLNMTNYQQNVLIESHQPKEKNEEKIAGGLVKVNEVKIKGFTFDLPEFLRRIKRKLK